MDKNLRNPGTVSFSEALYQAKLQTMASMNCLKVGEIISFDSSTQRAEVKIAFRQVKDLMEDGTRVFEEYPIIKECPVIFLFGGIDYITFPIVPGDSCLVMFHDVEIDQWAVQGTSDAPVSYRTHDLSDGIVLVGLRPMTNALSNYLMEGIRLAHGDDVKVELKDELIETIAELFLHNGDMEVTGDVKISGNLLVEGEVNIKGETLIEAKTTIDDNLYVTGTTNTNGLVIGTGGATGSGGTITINADIQHIGNYTMSAGNTLKAPIIEAGNGATGTYHIVTTSKGIVLSGSG